VAACYAATDLAHSALGWRAQLLLAAMCADAWRWQQALAADRTE
jgi:UDP-glucose 4-epimerase